jgi:hypothetical protein
VTATRFQSYCTAPRGNPTPWQRQCVPACRRDARPTTTPPQHGARSRASKWEECVESTNQGRPCRCRYKGTGNIHTPSKAADICAPLGPRRCGDCRLHLLATQYPRSAVMNQSQATHNPVEPCSRTYHHPHSIRTCHNEAASCCDQQTPACTAKEPSPQACRCCRGSRVAASTQMLQGVACCCQHHCNAAASCCDPQKLACTAKEPWPQACRCGRELRAGSNTQAHRPKRSPRAYSSCQGRVTNTCPHHGISQLLCQATVAEQHVKGHII